MTTVVLPKNEAGHDLSSALSSNFISHCPPLRCFWSGYAGLPSCLFLGSSSAFLPRDIVLALLSAWNFPSDACSTSIPFFVSLLEGSLPLALFRETRGNFIFYSQLKMLLFLIKRPYS